MADIQTLSVPVLVLLMAFEIASYLLFPDKDQLGYTARDTVTSLALGIGSVVANLGWGALTLVTFMYAHELTPLRIAPNWLSWTVAFVTYDLTYYWQHRASHRVRVLWAGHVAHHSSQRFNLSTGFRISWTAIGTMPIMLPLVLLGFHPLTALTVQSINYVYQFWIHTERIDRLWAPLEWLFNTPRNHRVHHGANPRYLDKNFAGVFMVWDRLFGTYEPESERAVYGLTVNIDTYNPLRVAFGEYAAIWRDLLRVRGLVTRLGVLFAPPAWSKKVTGVVGTAVAAASSGPTSGLPDPELGYS